MVGFPAGQQEADTPSERAACLCGSVMGVCLWFENPIACLFEQLVMPDNYFLVRQPHDQTFGADP
ncbi:hypothetical protein, partial [Brevibacterium sp. CCUG 69071]|uniref:hypothetical protein n=1 Tax=Brevibacterium sp. CCUG 69071 TaxID=2052937 RepID=UPI001E42516B